MSQANYAILRQGFHNQVDGARITNSKFSHLQGDAIEWNVAINDRNILISDHVIDNINCTNGKINWGIGIGLAVFLLDRSIDVKDKSLYMTTVTANNVLEGQLIGDWLIKQVDGKPCNVVELQGTVGASVAIDRKKGFAEAIAKAPNIKIIRSQSGGPACSLRHWRAGRTVSWW